MEDGDISCYNLVDKGNMYAALSCNPNTPVWLTRDGCLIFDVLCKASNKRE